MPDKPDLKEQRKRQDAKIRERLRRIEHKLLVMSGKGGVGKSSVAAYLAVALAKRGYRVGLMDVDLHGPSIPRLLGLEGSIGRTPEGKPRGISYLPDMEVISIEALIGENKDAAMIWRGPVKIGVIRQFISDLEWGDRDYLIIDSPPGTGDEPLTVAQTIPDARAVIVTTPQELSLADVRKSIDFCRHVDMKILGVVENMSGLVCPYCGRTIDLFKSRGGMLTAEKEGLELLGTLPVDPQVVTRGDAGDMGLLDKPDLPFTREFNKIVDKVVRLSARPVETAVPDAVKGMPARGKSPGVKLIVVPVSGGKLASYFGNAERFAFIEAMGAEVVKTSVRTGPSRQPGALPRWLREQGADVVIADQMGEKAEELLRENGVEVILGAPAETPETLAARYLEGGLGPGEGSGQEK
jgi:Mrp family chromosome partitioning ATPase/predicted Fe-Mo cluster-binding NifX family protein